MEEVDLQQVSSEARERLVETYQGITQDLLSQLEETKKRRKGFMFFRAVHTNGSIIEAAGGESLDNEYSFTSGSMMEIDDKTGKQTGRGIEFITLTVPKQNILWVACMQEKEVTADKSQPTTGGRKLG